MGYLLNSLSALSVYESETKQPYFVDKTNILRYLISLVDIGNKHVCITRPRRFGKTIMAAMVASFFSKDMDSSKVFDSLNIAKDYTKDSDGSEDLPDNLKSINYRGYMNQYDVIYINFIEYAYNCSNYTDFITSVKDLLQTEIRNSFQGANFLKNGTLEQDLRGAFYYTGKKFILVLDEWDCIFHKKFMSNDDRRDFINWLAALTKDTGYVALTYMTGILPIAKYSSGSTINNFDEYSMATDDKFNEFFGFTDNEVDELYSRYESNTRNKNVTREGLRDWYDGYHTPSSVRMYNPRSVVYALDRNMIRSYWITTGPYSEISFYIKKDMYDIQKDIALLVSGESVKLNVLEFAATSMDLNTRDEILSAMVVYGFLNYEDGMVHIPNKELMLEFASTIRNKENMGYVYRLASESEKMLQATLNGDIETMEKILQFAHDTEAPLLSYNNETELTAIVNLVYLSARDTYRVEREDKAGRGYVDFIFYPEKRGEAGIILELKVNDTPEVAIEQIKDRNYALKFSGKLAEEKSRPDKILLVGIGYNKESKKHQCKVEEIDVS